MSVNRWVYRVADGQLCFGVGAPDPALYLSDPVTYAIVDLGPDADVPNPRLRRAASAVALRNATVQEVAAFDAAFQQATFLLMSRRKDVLATCAEIVRARGIPAWNAMTVQQKKDAVIAEAEVWVAIRQFIEANL
jgi:hypothetical protein